MTLFDPLARSHRALDYHLQRHNVLASNVANVDTPGFEAAELVRETRESAGTPKATHANHIGARAGSERTGDRVERVVQPGGDGNSVSLEREMAKVSANDLRFETIGRIVRQQLGALRYAASDGQS
ncbi:MAG: flagellar basal body rod protein FlgB [Myxococcota bacterium]